MHLQSPWSILTFSDFFGQIVGAMSVPLVLEE